MAEVATQVGDVRDASEVVLEVTSNGVSHDAKGPVPFPGTPVRPSGSEAPKGARIPVVEFDLSEDNLRKLFSGFAENVGMHPEAAALRGEVYNTTLKAKTARVLSHRIRVQDVLVVSGAVVAVYVAYEGLATWLDWPSFNLFFGKKAADKVVSLRRAA